MSPGAPETRTAIHVSIVIPVFNEEAILHAAIVSLREQLEPHALSYEIVLAENGSRDATVSIAEGLERKYPELRHLSIPEPNYGKALRAGIHAARGAIVVCDEIDLCDVGFCLAAIARVESGVDLVVGSKLVGGAADERPLFRHAASLVYTSALRLLLGFQGTDTHGPKAFRRERLLPVVDACVVDRDVFASELVIRAYRSGLRVEELPLRLKELRPPSIDLWRRVPGVLRSLAKLTWAVRRG
jgi:glycosyltransferase involved in cell wall biosynthesis